MGVCVCPHGSSRQESLSCVWIVVADLQSARAWGGGNLRLGTGLGRRGPAVRIRGAVTGSPRLGSLDGRARLKSSTSAAGAGFIEGCWWPSLSWALPEHGPLCLSRRGLAANPLRGKLGSQEFQTFVAGLQPAWR